VYTRTYTHTHTHTLLTHIHTLNTYINTCMQVEGVQSAAEAEVTELEDDEEKKRRATGKFVRGVCVCLP